MNLIKKDISLINTKAKAKVQITLDDDFNVPDSRPDMEKLITERARIRVTETEPLDNRVRVKGELIFTALYLAHKDSKPIHSISGSLHFDEFINLDAVRPEDMVKVSSEIEDLNVSIINSRKLSVKSILSLEVITKEEKAGQVVTDVESEALIKIKKEKLAISQLVVNQHDIVRLKDKVTLEANKPSIEEILWSTVELNNIDTRLIDNGLQIKGDVRLFILYLGENEDNLVECLELDFPINSKVDMSGLNEEMISRVNINVQDKNIDIKSDLDGEPRSLELEVILELDVKAYQQDNIEIVSDAYSPVKNVIIETTDMPFENILFRNNTQIKLNQKMNVKDNDTDIMQICNTSANVVIDNINEQGDGIEIEGVAIVQLMYIAKDDQKPFGVIKEAIPFSQFIEIKDMNNDIIYDIKPCVAYISTNLLDSHEVEVKLTIEVEAFVIKTNVKQIISQMSEEPLNAEVIQNMPSVVAYIVKKTDTLWDIAKKYYSTEENIRKLNEIGEEVKPFDKIIITKAVQE